MKRGTDELMKFKQLARAMGLKKYELKGLLQEIWDFAAKNSPRGDIGRFSDEDIAAEIGWEGDPGELIRPLVKFRWLDEVPGCRLVVHDWAHHCEDSVKLALVKARITFWDGEIPIATKMNKVDRPAPEEFNGTRCAPDAHQMRTRCAPDAHRMRPTIPNQAIPNQAEPNQAEPNQAEPNRTKPNRTGSGRSANSASVSISESDRKALWERLRAVVLRRQGDPPDSRDAPNYREWWRTVCAAVAEHGGLGELEGWVKYAEDCSNPAIRKAKDLGELKRPSAWIAGKCRDFLAVRGESLPAPPGEVCRAS